MVWSTMRVTQAKRRQPADSANENVGVRSGIWHRPSPPGGKSSGAHPVYAHQILGKIFAEPVVREPLPEVQGYRWRGTLNGRAVLTGA